MIYNIHCTYLENMDVNMFSNVCSNSPSACIRLVDFLKKELVSHQEEVERVRSYEYGSEQYKKAKQQLPAVTLSATFNGVRRLDSIRQKNGIMVVDIDYKDNQALLDKWGVEQIKHELFQIPYVYAAALSASGKGIFLIIPIGNPDLLKLYCVSLQRKFEKMGVKIDTSCNDYTRLRIVSYDPDALVRTGMVEVYDDVDEDQLIEEARRAIKRAAYSSKPNSLVNNDTFCYSAVRLCIDAGLINDCKLNDVGGYNRWFAHACRLAVLGEPGRQLFSAISKAADPKCPDSVICRKFLEGSKKNNSRDVLAFYFGLLKRHFGAPWKMKVNEYGITLFQNAPECS